MRTSLKDKNIILKDLKKIFKSYPKIKVAYLFGSYATGEADAKSDIDIGILLEEGYDKMIKLDILLT